MKAILVGNPNVGKSYVLNRLTGSRVFVSNYPGTSVETNRGLLTIGKKSIEMLDMPGIYSLYSDTKEAAMLREVLEQSPDLVIQVLDAVNLERNLVLTLELMERNLPLVLLLNQVDRARQLGLKIDSKALSRHLNVPVFPFSAVTGEGVLICWNSWIKALPGARKCRSLPGMIRSARDVTVVLVEAVQSLASVDMKRFEQARILANKTIMQLDQVQLNWLDRIQNAVDHPLGHYCAAGAGLSFFYGFAALYKSK